MRGIRMRKILRVVGGSERAELRARIAELEADVQDLRRHHVRLAELVDVVQELLVPLSSRDQDRIDEAIENFARSL